MKKQKPKQQLNAQQELFRKQFELDNNERERISELKEKYRDRARERREGYTKTNTNGDYGYYSDDDEQQNEIKLTGLDYDLLQSEQNKIENQEQKNNQQATTNQKVLDDIKSSLISAKLQEKKEPCSLAKNIIYVLTQMEKDREKLMAKSKQKNSYYEYNIKEQVGYDLPQIIYKNTKDEIVDDTCFPVITKNCLEKVSKIMQILKNTKLTSSKLDSKQEVFVVKSEENNEDDLFLDVKSSGNKIPLDSKPPQQLKLLDENEEIFPSEKPVVNIKVEENKSEQQQEKSFKSRFDNDVIDQVQLEKEKIEKDIQEQKKLKRQQLLQGEDFYEECFQQTGPSIREWKKMKITGQIQVKQNHEKQKHNKSKNLDQQMQKIEKIMEEQKKK